MCHLIDRKADLSRTLPSTDAYYLCYETIRGDRQCLKSNFLCVYYVYPVYLLNFLTEIILCSFYFLKQLFQKG